MHRVMVHRKAFRDKMWVDDVGFLKVVVCIHGTIVAECEGRVLARTKKWSPSTKCSKFASTAYNENFGLW